MVTNQNISKLFLFTLYRTYSYFPNFTDTDQRCMYLSVSGAETTACFAGHWLPDDLKRSVNLHKSLVTVELTVFSIMFFLVNCQFSLSFYRKLFQRQVWVKCVSGILSETFNTSLDIFSSYHRPLSASAWQWQLVAVITLTQTTQTKYIECVQNHQHGLKAQKLPSQK